MYSQMIRCPLCQKLVKVPEGEMIPCPGCGYILTQGSARDVAWTGKIKMSRKKLFALCGIGGAILLALLFLLVFPLILRSGGEKEPREKQLQAIRDDGNTEEKQGNIDKSEEPDTDLKAYLSPRVAPSVSSEQRMELTDFAIQRGSELFVAFLALNEEEKAQSGGILTHKLIRPQGYFLNTESLETVTKTFVDFTGERVVESGLNQRMEDDEEREELYKLFEQYKLVVDSRWNYSLFYSYSDFDVELYISEKTVSEDGRSVYYVYSPGFDVIVEFDAEKLAWVEWDEMKFVDPHLLNVHIDAVSSIDISCYDVNATFSLQGTGQELKVTSSNGVSIDTDNFRQFYKALLFVVVDDSDEKPEEAESILKVRVCLRSGEEMNFEFFAQTARKAYCTLNGAETVVVNREYVKQIITACKDLLKGKEVVSEPKG